MGERPAFESWPTRPPHPPPSRPPPAGSLFDDEDYYRGCAPLQLTAPNGTSFEFRGVPAVLRDQLPAEALLTPPDAVGDAGAALSGAQLANQAVLRARECICRWAAAWLAPAGPAPPALPPGGGAAPPRPAPPCLPGAVAACSCAGIIAPHHASRHITDLGPHSRKQMHTHLLHLHLHLQTAQSG
jgi:hypothetical protein